VTVDGRLLLVRQFRPAADRVTLEVVSGHVEESETPEIAARKFVAPSGRGRISNARFPGTRPTARGRALREQHELVQILCPNPRVDRLLERDTYGDAIISSQLQVWPSRAFSSSSTTRSRTASFISRPGTASDSPRQVLFLHPRGGAVWPMSVRRKMDPCLTTAPNAIPGHR
jgi:hypothetical protein